MGMLNWCANPNCGNQAYSSHLICRRCYQELPKEMRVYIAKLPQWELFKQREPLKAFIKTWFNENNTKN